MRTNSRLRLGAWGEQAAADFLANLDYEIIDRNIRTPYGEIDILARQADCLVIVEVKTRASTSLGYPEISITPKKIRHLMEAAEAYLADQGQAEVCWRIDVIAIQGHPGGGTPDIHHFENIHSDR